VQAVMLGVIPLLPAIGFAILGLFGRRMSNGQVRLVACGVIGLAFVAALLSALPVLLGRLESATSGAVVVNAAARSVEVSLWEWLPLGARHGASPELHGERFLEHLSIPFGLYLDPLSAVMILVITGVGFLIHIYASEYMSHEGGYWRFFTYMNLFVAMMLILVLGSSFPLMFVGWEGVGLCSYLLIGFYYQQEVPPQAGLKAFLVNRIGDAGFLLGMLLLLLTFGSLRYAELFPRVAGASEYVGTGLAVATAALLFVGAMGKSAQFPLHVWLPDAMAGPTPVSALIHAATMVTAGVYLVIRANIVFQAAPEMSAIVAVVGLVTALMAASIALVQTDLKKVLAYSTVSQLGYMFIAVGVGAYAAGLFHLVTHAFFKALLFLGAGSVSHAMGGELDMRKMGGLAKKLPQTRWVMAIATWAIAGLPVLSGFWSKDEILTGVVTSTLPQAMKWAIWGGALLGALLTAFYMYRLYFMTFRGEPRWDEGVHPHESPAMMTLPLWILALLSAVGGVLGLAAWTGARNILHHALEPVVFPGTMVLGREALEHGTELGLAIVAIVVAATGALGAMFFYARRSDVPARAAAALPRLRELLRGKYWMDEILGALFVRSTLSLSALAARFDRKVIDFGVEMSGFSAGLLGEALRNLTSGRVRTYALGVLVGAAAVVSWMVLR